MEYLFLLLVLTLSFKADSQTNRKVYTDTSINNEAVHFMNELSTEVQVSVEKISGILKGVIQVESFDGKTWIKRYTFALIDTKLQSALIQIGPKDRITYQPRGVQISVVKVIMKPF